MKKAYLIFLLVVFTTSTFAKKKTILFSVEDEVVYEDDILEMLPTDKGTRRLSKENFNSVLNFYLTVYDIKQRKVDTTQVFKQKLEEHMIRALSDVYGSENHNKIIEECTVGRDVFAVVEDLFVPFEPGLLRMIENLKGQNTPFKEIVSYAMGQEGVSLKRRIIIPTESPMSLHMAACDLVEQENKILGPLKDLKGYHYLRYIREQENFGEYKVKVIFISNRNEQEALKKVSALKRALSDKKPFYELVQFFSEDKSLEKTKGITYYSPKIDLDVKIKQELLKLTYDGQVSPIFATYNGWYLIKRLEKKNFPTEDDLKRFALRNTRLTSFFIEDLKREYGVLEYPHHFLSGRSQILFLVDKRPFYTEDFEKYADEFGYPRTTETYDKFLNHLILDRYIKNLDKGRYQRLLDDYYFFQEQKNNFQKEDNKREYLLKKNLKNLVEKYKPVIPNKKYVQNNWIFDNN